MDYGPLLGARAGAGTIGGALAANLSGPRRIKAGAARDHFLGFTAVSGRGETFKSGGRVVKNVTGYDLCKLMAGSWGTLAAMTDVTVKTLPRAETEATVLVLGLDDAARRASDGGRDGLVCDVPARRICRRPRRAHRRGRRPPAARDRVPARRRRAVGRASQGRAGDAAGAVRHARRRSARRQSRAFWRAIRDVAPFAAAGRPAQRDLWRISTAPTRGADVGRVLIASRPAPSSSTTGPAASIWAALPPRDDAARAAGARRGRCGRRPCDADPRAGGACAPRSTCSRREEPALAALTKRVQGELRSARRAQSRAACGRACESMQTTFTLAQLADPDIAGVGKDPARLRALRLLHRDLPDLRARRRRARFAARAHLPDQGHAGARPAGDRRGRHAYRPLPVVPRLHDDLSVGRALHAPGRPCPRPYRAAPIAGRWSIGCCARLLARRAALSAPVPAGAARRRCSASRSRRCSIAIGLKPLAAMLRLAPGAVPQRPRGAADLSGAGRAPRPRRAARRLRQRRAGAADQRGHDPRADPPRHRGGAWPQGAGCCGSLVHHMGREDEALAQARANIDAWTRDRGEALDAIVITASGCGTTVKDYGFMLRDRSGLCGARRQACPALAKDISRISRRRCR